MLSGHVLVRAVPKGVVMGALVGLSSMSMDVWGCRWNPPVTLVGEPRIVGRDVGPDLRRGELEVLGGVLLVARPVGGVPKLGFLYTVPLVFGGVPIVNCTEITR